MEKRNGNRHTHGGGKGKGGERGGGSGCRSPNGCGVHVQSTSVASEWSSNNVFGATRRFTSQSVHVVFVEALHSSPRRGASALLTRGSNLGLLHGEAPHREFYSRRRSSGCRPPHHPANKDLSVWHSLHSVHRALRTAGRGSRC